MLKISLAFLKGSLAGRSATSSGAQQQRHSLLRIESTEPLAQSETFAQYLSTDYGQTPASIDHVTYVSASILAPLRPSCLGSPGVSLLSDNNVATSKYSADSIPVPIWGCRAQSLRFGTRIFSETVNKVDLSRRPFRVWTDEKEVSAETVIVATGKTLTLKCW